MDKQIPDKYERVTMRINGNVAVKTHTGSYAPPIDADEMQAIERLAIFEDKIENRTLVALPCKAGDTIYEVFKYHKPPFIQQTKVEKIIVTEKGLKLKLARNSFYETSIASLGKTLFLTEEAAEEQIKELQEKQK